MAKGGTAWIRVEVVRGGSPSERLVTFMAKGHPYALTVDARAVEDELLRVTVMEKAGDEVEVELPRTDGAGRRVTVALDDLLEEESPASGGWLPWALLAFVLLVVGVAFAVLSALE
jgi:hypothetical protein